MAINRYRGNSTAKSSHTKTPRETLAFQVGRECAELGVDRDLEFGKKSVRDAYLAGIRSVLKEFVR